MTAALATGRHPLVVVLPHPAEPIADDTPHDDTPHADTPAPAPAVDLADLLGDPNAPDRWQNQALCAQADPESWYPEKGGSSREAKRVCQGCPVRADCLAYALEHDERFGIWGGLSERERRALRRAR